MRKKIVFLSYQHRYLTDRVYNALAEQLMEFDLIYLDSDLDYPSYNENKNSDKKYLESGGFRVKYVTPNVPQFFSRLGYLNSLIKLIALRRWRFKLKKVVAKLNPDVIVCISDRAHNYKVIKGSNCVDCPFVIVQHGQIKKENERDSLGSSFFKLAIGERMNSKSMIVFNEDKDTRVLFWSPIWANHFPKEKKRRYVGAINYDRIFQTDYSSNKDSALADLGLEESAKVVLIALNKSINIGVEALKEFVSAYKSLIEANEALFFILKVHPAENMRFCEDLFDFHGINNVMFTKDADWDNLLTAADVFISHWSSTLYFALAADRPVILFSPLNEMDLSKRNLEGYQFAVSKVSDLHKQLSYSFTEKGRLDHKNFREIFVKRQMLSSDGKSALRAANAIRELVDGKW